MLKFALNKSIYSRQIPTLDEFLYEFHDEKNADVNS